ncbi:serine/arginine repetitive matrix protein 5-like [Palaemon carinicauda]|uniref:serine/arginine repetitive matrix protein 5-like n=1 Tax=Palaemon carinicauda TaxID=392227 RepID=UPI0035B618C3
MKRYVDMLELDKARRASRYKSKSASELSLDISFDPLINSSVVIEPSPEVVAPAPSTGTVSTDDPRYTRMAAELKALKDQLSAFKGKSESAAHDRHGKGISEVMVSSPSPSPRRKWQYEASRPTKRRWKQADQTRSRSPLSSSPEPFPSEDDWDAVPAKRPKPRDGRKEDSSLLFSDERPLRDPSPTTSATRQPSPSVSQDPAAVAESFMTVMQKKLFSLVQAFSRPFPQSGRRKDDSLPIKKSASKRERSTSPLQDKQCHSSPRESRRDSSSARHCASSSSIRRQDARDPRHQDASVSRSRRQDASSLPLQDASVSQRQDARSSRRKDASISRRQDASSSCLKNASSARRQDARGSRCQDAFSPRQQDASDALLFSYASELLETDRHVKGTSNLVPSAQRETELEVGQDLEDISEDEDKPANAAADYKEKCLEDLPKTFMMAQELGLVINKEKSQTE